MFKKFILLIFSLLIACSVVSNSASAISDMQDAPQTKYQQDKLKEKVDKEKKKKEKKETVYQAKMDKQGGVSLKPTKYPYEQYRPVAYIDGGWNPVSSENLMKAVNLIADISFKVNLFISEKVDYFLSTWFDVQIIEKLVQPISELSSSMFNPMKENLIPFIFSIGLVFAVAYFLMGQVGKSMGVIFKGAMIFGLALVWFTSQVYLINTLNSISEDGQSMFMSANEPLSDKSMQKGNEKQSTIAHIRNYYFETTVEKPYLLMNYGEVDKSKIDEKKKNRVDELLQLKQNKEGNKKREEIAKKEVSDLNNSNMNSDSPGNKIVMGITTTALNILISVPLLAVALFDMFLQVMIPLTMLFLPIVFALSMLPQLSMSIGKSFANLGMLFFLKMLVGILVTLTFTVINISEMITPITSEGSYIGNLLVTILIYFLIFKFRNQLISVVSGGAIQTTGKQKGRPGENKQKFNPKEILKQKQNDRLQKQSTKQREISQINNDLRQSEQVSKPRGSSEAQQQVANATGGNTNATGGNTKGKKGSESSKKKSTVKELFNKRKNKNNQESQQPGSNQESQQPGSNQESQQPSNNQETQQPGSNQESTQQDNPIPQRESANRGIPLSAKGKQVQEQEQSKQPEYNNYPGNSSNGTGNTGSTSSTGSRSNHSGNVPRPQKNWETKDLRKVQKDTLQNNEAIKKNNKQYGGNPDFNKAKKDYAEYRKNHNKKKTEDKFKNTSSSPYYKEGVKQARRLEKQKSNLQILTQNKDKVLKDHKTYHNDSRKQTRVNRGEAYRKYIDKGSS